jgi:predicted 2-oxoglutarate/Fe(II)-dependent dioxygenase YbiX
MVLHKDTHFPAIIDEQIGKPFYQVSVLLSRKDVDFFSGGGFVMNKNNEKIDLENEGGFGSLVIFDGRTYHSVEDVDLDQVIDFSRPDGRLAAFVSLYAVK